MQLTRYRNRTRVRHTLTSLDPRASGLSRSTEMQFISNLFTNNTADKEMGR